MRKEISSMDEYEREYHPKSSSLLERLEEKICKELNLTERCQHALNKASDDNKAGCLDFCKDTRYSTSRENVLAIVKSFYENEGYLIKINPISQVFSAEKDKKEYWVILTECDFKFTLWIIKSQALGSYGLCVK